MKENLIDLGLAGWMADFGEYTPVEARSDYAARYDTRLINTSHCFKYRVVNNLIIWKMANTKG